MPGPLEDLELEARRSYARWNPELWERVVDGPARTLARQLERDPADHANAVLTGYLRLAAEGIGLGLLSTAEPPPNVLSLLFLRIVPEQLAGCPAAERTDRLAQAWNLGENVERQPGWLKALFLRLCSGAELRDLPSLVDAVQRRALDPPVPTLDRGGLRASWIHLAAEDPRFLPGAAHFVAPTVCCVHDRNRSGRGQAAVCLGVWLDEQPVVLGPTGCSETPRRRKEGLGTPLRRRAEEADPRIVEVHSGVHNEWRAAVTLETSQFLVGLQPGG